MGAVHESDTDQRSLRAENLRIQLVQRFPAHIIVAVAGGSGKAAFRHPLILECLHHPQGVLLRHLVNFRKSAQQALLHTCRPLPHCRLNIFNVHVSSFSLKISVIISLVSQYTALKSEILPMLAGEWIFRSAAAMPITGTAPALR